MSGSNQTEPSLSPPSLESTGGSADQNIPASASFSKTLRNPNMFEHVKEKTGTIDTQQDNEHGPEKALKRKYVKKKFPVLDKLDETNNISISSKRKKLACVECRQQKSKCDAHEKSPAPCSKCAKKNIPCILKENFRRTYKRAKSEAIESKFRELTESLSLNISPEELLNKIAAGKDAIFDREAFTKDKVIQLRKSLNNQQFAEKLELIRKHSTNFNESTMRMMLEKNTMRHTPATDVPQETSTFSSPFPSSSSPSYSNVNTASQLPKNILSASSIDSAQPLNNNNNNNNNHTHNDDNNNREFSTELEPNQLWNPQLTQCTTKTLGEVTLEPSEISELYLDFVYNYHIFLPIVNVLKGPEAIHKLSPCLFWVIMLIGLRRNERLQRVSKTLSPLVKSILAEITISPIIRYLPQETDQPLLNVSSVYSVQAFLLYSFWPSLTSSLSADTSWNTIGSACFQAIRVGLNSAQFSTEYKNANVDFINEQIKTWVSCNTASQIIASTFGFPSFVTFDHSVLKYGEIASHGNRDTVFTIPEPIKQMMQIAHFQHQVTETMNSNKLNPLGIVDDQEKLPILKVLEQQLNELEIRLQKSDLDHIRRFLLLVSKVYLFAYYFNSPKTDQNIFYMNTAKNNDHESAIDDSGNSFVVNFQTLCSHNISYTTKIGLVKVYNASIELLQHANAIWISNHSIIKYFPGVFVLNIWQAACIICKLVHSSLAPMIDVELGTKVYNIAVSLTYNASVMKFDLAYRSSRIMKSIWVMYKKMYEQWKSEDRSSGLLSSDKVTGQENNTADYNLDLTIQSRLSVSVFFDCLYVLKQQTGLAKLKREQMDKEAEARPREGSSGEEKESAREIIDTIPLDPAPINAPVSSNTSSATTSPEGLMASGIPATIDQRIKSANKGRNHVTSLKSILNKSPPKDGTLMSNSAESGFSSIARPQKTGSSVNSAPETTNVFSPTPSRSDSEPVSSRNATNLGNGNSIQGVTNETTHNQHGQALSTAQKGSNFPANNVPELENSASTAIQPKPSFEGLFAGLNNVTERSRKREEPLTKTPYLPETLVDGGDQQDRVEAPQTSGANSGINAIFSTNKDLFENWDTDPVWEDVDVLLNEFAFNPTV
ncbi:hypothetical protein ACO0RG_000038 [Hanseniaspora osmophila]